MNVGASLYEPDLIDTAKQIMKKTNILLPSEVVVADKNEIDFDDFLGSLERTAATVKPVDELNDTDMILDISKSKCR